MLYSIEFLICLINKYHSGKSAAFCSIFYKYLFINKHYFLYAYFFPFLLRQLIPIELEEGKENKEIHKGEENKDTHASHIYYFILFILPFRA